MPLKTMVLAFFLMDVQIKQLATIILPPLAMMAHVLSVPATTLLLAISIREQFAITVPVLTLSIVPEFAVEQILKIYAEIAMIPILVDSISLILPVLCKHGLFPMEYQASSLKRLVLKVEIALMVSVDSVQISQEQLM